MEKPRYRAYAQIESEPEYNAGPRSKRMNLRMVSNSGPNAALRGNLDSLRKHTRQAYRNSPLVRKAIKAGVTNEIGTGIIPRFQTKDLNLRDTLRSLFDAFAKQCDPEFQLDIYGLQAHWATARRVSGEVFIRRRPRSASENLLVPLQLQTLEADYVPIELNELRKNGNRIVQGIEFNKRGRRVAYWVHASHPGEFESMVPRKLIRVRAQDMIHLYRAERPGQVRGEPLGVSGLLTMKLFDSYNYAELNRKESRSGFTGMLTRPDLEDEDWMYDPITGEKLDADAEGPVSQIRTGTVVSAPPGTTLTMFDGDNTGSGYKDYMRERKLEIATAYEVPFELVTGDWSGVNDRIYRAFIQEYRRGVRMDQDNLMIFQVLERIKVWLFDSLIANRLIRQRLPNDFNACEWCPEAWKHIHPVQDIQAQVMAKDNDLAADDDLVAEMGYDAEEVDRKNIEAELRRKKMREEAGLASKHDDKVTPSSGPAVDPEENEDDDADPDEQDKK